LLLTDLNSSIPVSITPGNIQAIIIGNGKTAGEIKYIKDNLIEKIQDQTIAYTSGAGSIFKSGIPVGTVKKIEDNFLINFYSDFQQLKYVFAEIKQNKKIKDENDENLDEKVNTNNTTNTIKLNILNEELKILSETNEKFLKENQILKSEINKSKNKMLELEKINETKDSIISQHSIDQKELEFLRLNLIHSSKCKKTAFRKGHKVGTKEYKDCILRKGKIND